MIFTELNLRNFWMINVKKINVEKKRNNVSQDTFSAMIYTYFMHSLNK